MQWSIYQSIIGNRELISQFVKREITGRYKGSYLGLLWTFLTPLLMLTIYTYVFSEVFRARWGGAEGSKVEYALVAFTGLIIFNIFGEMVSRAPTLILNHTNYVTKVVFPLEILPISVLMSALIHAAINMIILIIGLMIFLGVLQWTLFLLPLVVIPIVLLSLGFGWILSSIGVYLRDVGQFVGLAVQALMMLSPIFYSVDTVPKSLKFLYYLNPISYVIEDTRRVVIWGQMPQWSWLCIGTLIGLVIFYLGYICFMKTKSGFADVI